MSGILLLLLGCIIAYLIGSIPTAYWLGKWGKGIDIRKQGSGNVGATNALRVLGKSSGLLVLLVDVGKGVLAVRGIPKILLNSNPIEEPWVGALLGLCVIMGHIWTLFLKFQGGKGVATSLGVFLSLDPLITGISLLVWSIVLLLTRYVSISSIIAALTLPSLMALWARPFAWTLVSGISCLLICYRHRPNIQRLLLGNEKKIGQSK